MFAAPPRSQSAIVGEVEAAIAAGRSDASLIAWSSEQHNPSETIAAAVADFERVGWRWTGYQIEKGGWYAFFRSQGILSPPIIQWNRGAK